MGFPENILDDGEAVVQNLRPHWRRIVFPILLLIIVVGVASYLLNLHSVKDHKALMWLVIAVAVVILVWLCARPILVWLSTRYVLTNRRVLMRSGVLSRSGRDVPLTRVNDVSFQRTLIERMFGSGTLTIESAGERGQVLLKDVPHVEAVQRDIYRLVEDEAQRLR
jgi:uncharacterized membrane protein YdbT with pleckstrin-like domain